jgi:hypothetical protein
VELAVLVQMFKGGGQGGGEVETFFERKPAAGQQIGAQRAREIGLRIHASRAVGGSPVSGPVEFTVSG